MPSPWTTQPGRSRDGWSARGGRSTAPHRASHRSRRVRRPPGSGRTPEEGAPPEGAAGGGGQCSPTA
eukprot:2460800-Alexandrium_andersonii.AAC.1